MNKNRDIIEPGITEHLHDAQKPIEIKILVPKYIFNLLNKMSELSGVCKERIINNSIISELQSTKDNPAVCYSLFLKDLITEMDSCITNFKDDFALGIYGV